MSGERIMWQVTDVNHGPDGMSVQYGPGELHEPGGLPEGIRFRAVVADDVDREIAPAWAQPAPPPPPPEPVKVKADPAGGSPEAKTTGTRAVTADPPKSMGRK